MPKIFSWNIMFRKYEILYHPESKIIETYPNENDRIDRIISILRYYITCKTFLCLQEVSSKILEKIIFNFENTHKIFSYCIRSSEDENEYLVTVAPKEFNFNIKWSGEHETSNGYLVIQDDKTTIINCHLLPQRYAKSSVMDYLREFLIMYSGNIFIAGDFNENHKKLKNELYGYYICPYYGKTYRKKPIDNIIFAVDKIKYRTSFIKHNYLSDHYAILLDFLIYL